MAVIENAVQMHEKVKQIIEMINQLQKDAEDIPAVNQNVERALASFKMIELNISDPVTFNCFW